MRVVRRVTYDRLWMTFLKLLTMFDRQNTSSFLRFIALLCCICLNACSEKSDQSYNVAQKSLYAASISANGQAFLIGSFAHGGSYWQIDPLERLYNWNHKKGFLTEILYSDISKGGQFAVSANDYNLVLWDTQTGAAQWFWAAPARIKALDLSQDGQWILLGMDNNQAVLFNVRNAMSVALFEHDAPITSVALNTQASIALTGSDDGTVRLWNIKTNSLIKTFTFSNRIALVALSDSGRLALMSASNEKPELWNLEKRQKIAALKTSSYRVHSARFTANNTLLLGTTHRMILAYDTRTGAQERRWLIGNEGKHGFRSAFILDMNWSGRDLIALSSNGYLYRFQEAH